MNPTYIAGPLPVPEAWGMCDHDVFDTRSGTHRCPLMPRRIWFGPIMIGRIDQTPFAHDGECGWAVGVAGVFVAWTGWR